MGNGAKAQQKRERAGEKGKKEPSSQLKSNAAAKTVKSRRLAPYEEVRGLFRRLDVCIEWDEQMRSVMKLLR
ncbi:unnamed protein product [Zymoseptoria tritici ST99CH_1E4]|nr:unnamed protein product [Zymoseptoria tritici ST99CH_1E4]